MTVTIKENSWLARIAAHYLNSDNAAMVLNRTIHLHNATREQFLKNKKWVRHEVAHVKQWQKLGKFRFLIAYLMESFNKGYENNKFEVDARKKESDINILDDVYIV